jgi:hypothetical protein
MGTTLLLEESTNTVMGTTLFQGQQPGHHHHSSGSPLTGTSGRAAAASDLIKVQNPSPDRCLALQLAAVFVAQEAQLAFHRLARN